MDIHAQKILILDFGSTYTQLIARRVRELKVYCEIHPYNCGADFIKKFGPKGIILSGGPSSVYDKGAPVLPKTFFADVSAPVLGICYGMQLTARLLGGKVERSKKREYGASDLRVKGQAAFFSGLGKGPVWVWVSTCDREAGNMRWFLDPTIPPSREKVGDARVVCGISGGVDSAVAALLVHKAIGNNLTCIFVDNGVLRKGEADKVESTLRKSFHLNIKRVNASARVLKKVEGVEDPERKRKIIGGEFVRVFDEQASKIKNVKFLAQ